MESAQLSTFFHIVKPYEEYDDGKIVLEPRVLTKPFTISENSLSMMDASMKNFKEGKVAEPIDFSEYEDVK